MSMRKETRPERSLHPLPLLLVFLLPVCEYLWTLWYYGGLYQSGALLGASLVTRDSLGPMLMQHLTVNLPCWMMAAGALVILKRDFAPAFGLAIYERRGWLATSIAGGLYLLLPVALLLNKGAALATGYQWFYFLFFIALTEEFVFRGVLPWLMEKSGLPDGLVWVVPGLLFGFMHSIMPLIQTWNGSALHLAELLLSPILGGLAGGCVFYWLRRWSGTLWLPVLLHAALDFLGAIHTAA